MNPNVKSELINLLERHSGRQRAILRREIRNVLNIPNSEDRQLREVISELRLEGFPILFSTGKPGGYYLPETLGELKEGIAKMRSYVIDECKIMRAWRLKGSQYINGEKQAILL